MAIEIKCVLRDSEQRCHDLTILGTVEDGVIVRADMPARMECIGSRMVRGWSNCDDTDALEYKDDECAWSIFVSRAEAKRIGL